MSTTPEPLAAQVCIVGGGPAGMMAAFLLARANIPVILLEKHPDFLRDFRGDTIHPSTLELLFELNLLDDFLKRPHQKIKEISIIVAGKPYKFADLTHLPTHCKFVALMPQWDFLNFLKSHAEKLLAFKLLMQTKATDLLESNNTVTGVLAQTQSGPLEIHAPLTIAADGRHSTMRTSANLKVEDLGAPIDVLWMRISRLPTDPGQVNGRIDTGKLLVMIDRNDYWQCGYVIRKGGNDQIRAQPLENFRQQLLHLAPLLTTRVNELQSWDQIKLLTVSVDRLLTWHRPGLLCIGDAAHAMSPVGGVGINLAIQDAVATANLLTKPLKLNTLTDNDLAQVQARREIAAKKTQALQLFVHRRFLTPLINSKKPTHLPWYLRLALAIPQVRRIPARVIGIGFQPEHITTPPAAGTSRNPAWKGEGSTPQ